MATRITATAAARRFREVLDAVEHRGEQFEIERHGRVIAAIERWEGPQAAARAGGAPDAVRDGGQAYATAPNDLGPRIAALAPELQHEIEDFIVFVTERRQHDPRPRPSFAWTGALKPLRDEYSSVELQHRIADWRAGEE